MTTPLHRLRVLLAIWRAWRKMPSLRLGQLVVNLAGERDPFYMLDADMARAAESWPPAPTPIRTVVVPLTAGPGIDPDDVLAEALRAIRARHDTP